MLSDVRSLAGHRLINAERFAGCGARPGYRALAYDVLMLVQVLKEAWNRVHGRTPVTLAELDQAAVKAETLLRAVGLRDHARPTVAEATVLRRKAFALFMRAYAKARAAVQYLRAEVGDADDIAPSLYAGRAKRRKSERATPKGSSASLEVGNDSGGDSPPSQRSVDDAVPAPERLVAAVATDGAVPRSRSSVGDDIAAGLAQLFGMLLSGRGPPVGKA